MHSVSSSAVAANLADTFASRDGIIDLTPRAAASAALAVLTESDRPEPTWDAESYDPTPADWQEYSAWCRSLDGGCGLSELTPDEQSLILHSCSEQEYWEAVAAEYDAARDAEECFADLWS